MTELEVWKAVAVALMSELVDAGPGDLSWAIRAYNEARNGGWADAELWLR